jgi:hypothetical protein
MHPETVEECQLRTINEINAVQNGLIVDGKPPPLQSGGDSEPKADDTIDDIREEIGRVIHTAMNHLKLLKARDHEILVPLSLVYTSTIVIEKREDN